MFFFRNENLLPHIDQLKSTWTYTPSLTYVKRTFLNHEDQKFYTAGYDSIWIENNRPKRRSSFYNYQYTAVMGNDTIGVRTSHTYTYKDDDSLEMYIYQNRGYDTKMETVHYTYNKKGELVKYESTSEGEASPSVFFTVLGYADTKGWFEKGSGPFGTEIYKGLPTGIKTETTSSFVSTSRTKWSFDSQKRPIGSHHTVKSGSDSTQTFYRFEY